MERKKLLRITLFFEASDSDAAAGIGRAAEESIRLVRDVLALASGGDLRVYVMNSWPHFLLHSAPWPWRILLGLSFPLWAWRVSRLWRIAGGWMQRYGRRLAVGVKPPRLIQSADRSIGARIFLDEENMAEKMRHITCHEVTHACTARLKLPAWLNEGLAMYMVDRLLGKATVRAGTAISLAQAPARAQRRNHPAFSSRDPEAFIRCFVLGYWRVRFLEETRPGLLKKLLAEDYRPGQWREPLAAAYQPGPGPVWENLDRLAAAHFQNAAGG